MKVNFCFLAVFLLASCFFTSCDNSDESLIDPTVNGYEAPAAPEIINPINVLRVDYFSRLTNKPLFTTADYSNLVTYLNTDKKALALFFDRSDHVIGEPSIVMDLALQTKTKPFFVQQNQDVNHIFGTGILVRSYITQFDGVAIPDSLYLGGATLSAPLSQPITITLMTCVVDNQFQYKLITKYCENAFQSNRIIVGRIKTDLSQGLADYLKYNLKDFRFKLFSSQTVDKSYCVFVLSPLQFVARQMNESLIGGLPLNQISLEYISEH